MPIAGPIFGGLLLGQFSAMGFKGTKIAQLAMAIGNGTANYLMSAAIYQGAGVGTTPGAGVGTGFVQGIVGPAAGANVMAMMTAMGFKGTKIMSMSMAIGNAFAQYIKMGIVQSSCLGMAIGSGIGKIIVVGPAMGASISGMMMAMGFKGTKAVQFAMAVGNGLCLTITSMGIVTTIVAGAGYPPTPMSGADIGKIM